MVLEKTILMFKGFTTGDSLPIHLAMAPGALQIHHVLFMTLSANLVAARFMGFFINIFMAKTAIRHSVLMI